MKKYIIIFMAYLTLLLTGCSSTKHITIVDTYGKPINNCYVFAQQSNMLYYNTSNFFFTNQEGHTVVPYYGSVRFYAGKSGYFISTFTLVGNENVKIILYSINDKVPEANKTLSFFSEDMIPNELKSNLIKKWIKYAEGTSINSVNPIRK